MFNIYYCKKCNSGYRVSVADPHLFLVDKKFMHCPNREACNSRVKRLEASDQTPKFDTKIISAKELYAATMGMGFANERVCSPKNLRKLLVGKQIIDIAVDASADPQRSFIYSITVEGGKVFHFATSTQAATVYKMTEVNK